MSRSTGIGFATATRLLTAGTDVFTQGWAEGSDPPTESSAVVEGAAGHLEADLADPASPAAVMAAARVALGHVDVLIANHAASVPGTLEEISAESLDLAHIVNVRATLLLVQAFAAEHAGGAGRVILLTSGQGRGPMPLELPYATSKAALSGIVPSLAEHLAPRGITVNAVNPGPTDTGWPSDELREQVTARMPRGRWGAPDDAARLIAWLASEHSGWVTGQVIDSDGGFRYGI